jgi:ATP phosphoribosyltransferase
MSDKLVFAVPAKGRLMEQAIQVLAKAGLRPQKTASERGYRGELEGFDGVDVAFVSALEIVQRLKSGQAHLGITGEDLLRENIADADAHVEILRRLGFGHADVVVAVPQCWIDVRYMADLQVIAASFRHVHGRRIRVATRRFLLAKGVSDYRIVESLGATEGAPASGAADLIVDITSTGATLRANGLKALADGLILRSEACLVASQSAAWNSKVRAAQNEILARLGT